MTETNVLRGKDRRFILDFSIMIGATSDAIESLRFEKTSSDYARGYLECLSKNGDDRTVLLAYFLLSLLTAKGTAAE
ncbi:MAG: hypothetical protein IKO41_11540 [Lachnospiraceae bacterium]|nr:hypothetical protein [Lachnospiraceae bacterium]